MSDELIGNRGEPLGHGHRVGEVHERIAIRVKPEHIVDRFVDSYHFTH
ncbi:hypothetical protein ACF061_23480 [Streptomyces sp. NPDC015220]